MSILARIIERRDLTSSQFRDPNRLPLNSDGYASTAGAYVDTTTATRLSAVFAAVRLVSQTVAALPVGVYRKAGAARLELPLPMWMLQPNPDFNWFEFIEQIMCSLLLWGNAYVVMIPDANANVGELWVISPDRVRIVTENGRRIYKVSLATGTEDYGADQIMHIRGTSRPGCLYGMSPIDEARQSLGLALAAEGYGARFFNSSATPPGVIEIPNDPGRDALRGMALGWKAAHQGPANAHEPGFLVSGATWKSISVPNDSAQFIETRKLQISEIARWFGVPAHKIGDLEHATFANIEHQAIEFVTDGIMPWVVRLEARLDPLLRRGLLPDRRTDAFVKFNLEGLLRGDSAARAAFYNTMRNIGAYNADEIRALEDKAPIPGGAGAIYWQPANMAAAGSVPTNPSSLSNGTGSMPASLTSN